MAALGNPPENTLSVRAVLILVAIFVAPLYYIGRGFYYAYFHRLVKTRFAPDIINTNNEDHNRMRRLLSHAFSEKALRNQEDVLKRHVDDFIDRLSEQAKKDVPIDMVRWYNFATFELIGDLAFGEPFGCLTSGGYHPWVKLIFDSVKILPLKQVCRRLGIESLIEILAPPAVKKGAAEHWELSQQTALRRLDTQNTEREDFMSYILRHNDKNGLSKKEILTNANILIVTGSATTSTLLSGTVSQLLTNRHTYDQLVMEIRSAFASEDEITLNAVNRLKYLIAIFNEGLRMYPPVPSNLPRASPAGGEVVEGYFIPENTAVSVPHWSAYRAQRNFRNPDKFAPERWLDDTAYESDDKAVLQPFSFGPRNCIGKNLAYAEMRLMLVRLLWKFDVEIMQDSLNWDQ